MLMKMPTRSGDYALAIRYRAVGIGVDTDKWQVVIADETQRRSRHRAILWALHDTLLSPEGALTASMLPHLTGLQGAVVVKKTVGRAPMYSGLVEDFVVRLQAMQTPDCAVYSFETVDAFSTIMQQLVMTSFPSFPAGQASGEHQREAQG